jgi:HK97 family phage portal protein
MLRRVLSWLGYDGLFIQEGSQNPTPNSYSGPTPQPVSFDTAMQLSAVWACSRLLSETVAGLPLEITDRRSETGEALRSDVADLFNGKVNRYQTRFEFMETMMLNLVMRGNCYALKQFSGQRLVGLIPLMASQVETRLMLDGSVVHYYYSDTGVTAYASETVWHVKLFGNGIVGLSPLGYARNTIGTALAGERRISQTFQNGGKPTGVLMIDKTLTDNQRNQVRKEFNDLREGNSDKLMVLEASMKYEKVSMSPEDIELLDSRRFSIEDLARFFGVPSVLINDTSGSTTWGSGIEQIVQGFYKLNLRPYLERFEASIIHNLMAPSMRGRAIVEFNFDALLRSDRAARAEARSKEIQFGQITPNEARAEEGRPPMAGGDELYVNSTMIPLTRARNPVVTPEGGNNGI